MNRIPKFPRLVTTRPMTEEEAKIIRLTAKEAAQQGASVATKCRDIDTGEMKSCEKEDNHTKMPFFVQKA